MSARSRRRRKRDEDSAARKYIAGFRAWMDMKQQAIEDADEMTQALIDAASEATPGPYCMFSDDGHAVSVMPAGRPGDVCKVEGCVNSDANARWFALATPENVLTAIRRAGPGQGDG